MKRVAIPLIVLLQLVALVTQVASEPEDFSEMYLHMLAASVNVAAIALALGPLRRGENWAWWVLLIVGFGEFGGVPISTLVTEDDPSDNFAPLVWAGYGVLFLACLAVVKLDRARRPAMRG